MVGCRSRNQYQNATCLKEIGLPAQILSTILVSIVNTVVGTYLKFQWPWASSWKIASSHDTHSLIYKWWSLSWKLGSSHNFLVHTECWWQLMRNCLSCALIDNWIKYHVWQILTYLVLEANQALLFFDISKFSFTSCSNVRTPAQCNRNTKQQTSEVLFTLLLGHTNLLIATFLSFTMQQSWKMRCQRKDGFKPNIGSDTKLSWLYISTYGPQCVASENNVMYVNIKMRNPTLPEVLTLVR